MCVIFCSVFVYFTFVAERRMEGPISKFMHVQQPGKYMYVYILLTAGILYACLALITRVI